MRPPPRQPTEAGSRGRTAPGRVRAAAAPGVFLLLAGCGGAQSALAPAGPDAAVIARLHWVLLALAVLVTLVVLALLGVALWRRRDFSGERPPLRLDPLAARTMAARGRDPGSERTLSDDEPLPVRLDTAEEDRRSVRWIAIGGVAVPALILVGTYLYTLGSIAATHPRGETPAVTVEVIGRQWWWEVKYLDAAGREIFETANEIHLPVGERVRLRLKAADVIHSFWVPSLGGKLDMIPGRTNQFSLRADREGTYRGQCAEYCAGAHALMALLVIAEPREEFDRWMQEQTRGEPPLDDPLALAGRAVFLRSACAACHAVRGTAATGDLGPDLTHLASRRTLAAVTLPNTEGHLGGWLQNPRALKPAARMPAVPLESEAFLALLRYLRSLR